MGNACSIKLSMMPLRRFISSATLVSVAASVVAAFVGNKTPASVAGDDDDAMILCDERFKNAHVTTATETNVIRERGPCLIF